VTESNAAGDTLIPAQFTVALPTRG
jgi:hypothetical protein